MITITIPTAAPALVAMIEELARVEAIHNPAFNGAAFEVESGEALEISGSESYDKAALFAAVADVLRTHPEGGWGFEVRSGGQWDRYAAGQQDSSNTFATEAEAEEKIPGLAEVFECDESEIRVAWIPFAKR